MAFNVIYNRILCYINITPFIEVIIIIYKIMIHEFLIRAHPRIMQSWMYWSHFYGVIGDF